MLRIQELIVYAELERSCSGQTLQLTSDEQSNPVSPAPVISKVSRKNPDVSPRDGPSVRQGRFGHIHYRQHQLFIYGLLSAGLVLSRQTAVESNHEHHLLLETALRPTRFATLLNVLNSGTSFLVRDMSPAMAKRKSAVEIAKRLMIKAN
jgi:hypothetical protein